MIRVRVVATVALGVLLVAALPGALAASSASSTSSTSASANQNVNIPRENVLSALALGASGPAALQAISSGSSGSSLQSTSSHSVSLDLNDVLGAIALGRNGAGFGTLGSGGFGLGFTVWSGPAGLGSFAPMPCESWSWSWCGMSSMGSLARVGFGNETLLMLPSGMASSFLATYHVGSVPGPVLVGNNTTVAAVLASMAGNNTTTLAPGVTEVMLANGGALVLVAVSDQVLSRLG